MRVIPLTSLLSHKGRGGRSPNRVDTLSLEVEALFKHPPRGSLALSLPLRCTHTEGLPMPGIPTW